MKPINSPGKVLFFGGYSILIPGNTSLSIAVIDVRRVGVKAKFKKGRSRLISPQFDIDINPTIEDMKRGVLISYPYILTKIYLSERGSWSDVEVELENSKIMGLKKEKTGLGSSAAATTSIIKALFRANGYCINAHREIIHKIGQYSYAFFSKKAGSGFDIATATYEKSLVYSRFLEEEIELPKNYELEEIKIKFLKSIERPWKGIKIKPLEIKRKGLDLLFFNMVGSRRESISAVNAFKVWKKSHPHEFSTLMRRQNAFERIAIHSLKHSEFDKVREYTHKAREIHYKLQEEIKKVVDNFEEIESEEVKNIINSGERINGVIAGRNPGAGGNDGIAFLIKEKSNKKKIASKITNIARDYGVELENVEVEVV